MKVYSSDNIRNVAILGHSGCGKTTLAESMLNIAAITTRVGKVEDGNTVSDFDAEEIKRKVSISSSILPFEWLDNKVNIIDTPGYFDFVGEVKEALRACDIALIVVSAKSGVEVGTEKAWEYAVEHGIPRIVFVNEMDDANADLDKVVTEMKEKFGKSISPLQVPFKEGEKFVGFVNAIKRIGRKYVNGKTQDCEIPEGLEENVENMRLMIEEAVAETSDTLMDKFFNEERFTDDEIFEGLSRGLETGEVTPVICGSALYGIGVRVLMNYFMQIMHSSRVLRPEIKVENMKSKEEESIECVENENLSALVFKTIADPYVGKLNIFRVFSGVITKNSVVYNATRDITEKISHLYVLRGKEQIEVSEIRAGDIGAISKSTGTKTGDTLCTKENPYYIEKIKFPIPLMSMAVAPKGKGDEEKIGQALGKMLEEDKTLKFEVNKETKQAILTGIGESHLDVIVNKLKEKYKLEVVLSEPIVPYREKIKGKSKVQGKYKKQSGGHGQYGDVHMEFEPSSDMSKQYVFEEKIFGGAVPRNFFPAVEKGIQECVKEGPLAGYPVVGIKATLVDGSYHAVDSSEMAFKMATTLAFKDGFMKAKPVILEPIAKVDIFVPDDYTGDIMGDMNKRRGRILGMEKDGVRQKVSAEVPMSEMFRYPTDLRSMTQGRGEFTMEFDRYDEAPAEINKKVIEEHKNKN